MTKRNIPLFHIQQHCRDSGIADFKVGSFSEDTCTAVEFEEDHRHEYFEIIWLKNGTGNHQIDLHDYVYSGSVMFLLAPGQIHKIEQRIPSEGYIIKFLPSIFKQEKDFSITFLILVYLTTKPLVLLLKFLTISRTSLKTCL